MKVVGGLAVHTSLILAFLVLVKLLESIFCICVIFYMIALVLLYVTLILERKAASWTSAMEMSGFLPIELAFHGATVFGGSEALKAVINQLSVLLMEVFMCHHIRGARVHFVTSHLHAVVVCAFSI